MSKTALIAVDVQYDFINGALGGEGRGLVIPPLVKLAHAPRVDLVVASRDWHPTDHCSFAKGEPQFRDGSWPIHCVECTPGAKLALPIEILADVIVNKGTDPEAEAYSAFDGRVPFGKCSLGLEALLRCLGIEQVIVGGLCTDYCVAATAIDAARAGFEVTLPLEACAGVDPDTSRKAVEYMDSVGVRIVDTIAPALAALTGGKS